MDYKVIINSLMRPCDTILRNRSGWTLAQAMNCCLMSPSHYLNQCWLIIGAVLWSWPKGDLIGNAQGIHADDKHSAQCTAYLVTQNRPASLSHPIEQQWWNCNDKMYEYTVRCWYNAVNFLLNPHKRHPIARLLRRAMGCLFRVC